MVGNVHRFEVYEWGGYDIKFFKVIVNIYSNIHEQNTVFWLV